MVQLSWFALKIKKQKNKAFAPVNRMWTKRNGHAPKVNVPIFFKYVKKLEKKSSLTILFFSFSSLQLLFSKKNKIIKNHYNIRLL